MKALKKIQSIILSLALTLCCIAPALPKINGSVRTAHAANEYTDNANYYGKRLTDPVSIAFYDILESMDFASGEKKQIYDKVILDEAALYTVGDPSILKKLGAAIDSFRYDHTEYFYVDFDMLTLNVKTRKNTLIVELGAGRSDSYFIKGFTKDNITSEVAWYNKELDKFLKSVPLADNATTEQKAKAVTKAIAEKVTYDFCVDDNGTETEGAPFIRTAYGALKYGKCVCEGYSRIFKAVMDQLGEINVLVNGWLATDTETGAHMWNLVKSGDNWYGVDPTVSDEDTADYHARGLDWAQGELLGVDHFEDRIVSTSDYELPFPTIYRKDLPTHSSVGNGIEQDVDGLKVVVSEDRKTATISYNGKDAATLKNEGFYMAVRIVSLTDGVEDPNNLWLPISYCESMGITVTANNRTTFNLNVASQLNVKAVRFAICNADADSYNETTKIYDRYSNEFFAEHVVVQTDNAFINENNDPNYEAPIYSTPDCNLIALDTKDGEQPKTITVRYSRELVFDNETDTLPEITFTAVRTLDGAPVDVGSLASVTDMKRVGSDSVSFVFRPSISYAHSEVTYKFHLENMSCKRLNGKIVKPGDFSITARRTSIVCNKVFGDGKLYVEAFGTPTLVDNSDLSVNGWSYEDEHGNTKKVSQSQRSQLALVVKTPANKEQLEGAVESTLGKSNVKNMATYELELNICSRIASIPQDSYLKLSFGFPDGITADMAGVEFEVFHFKKDANGNLDYTNPERLNCVVTKYGLTVTVNSFSPFVIVAREKTAQDDARKGVLTALNGVGGTITADTHKPVNFLEAAGERVTYTLTPDEGYAVEYALLGGKELNVENGKVTVSYADLSDSNNILSVGFAKQSVLDQEKAAGEVNAVKSFAAKTYDKTYAAMPVYDYPEPDGGGLSGGIIALIVVMIVVVLAGVGILVWYLLKKKDKGNGKKGGTKISSVKKNTRAQGNKSAAAKQTKAKGEETEIKRTPVKLTGSGNSAAKPTVTKSAEAKPASSKNPTAAGKTKTTSEKPNSGK